jgi:nucleoside-triphosphatase THEP1
MSALEASPNAGARSPRAAILTGEQGAGKTTLCLSIAQSNRQFGGLVSPSLLNAEGRGIGICARCLETGEEWVLARTDGGKTGLRFGRFSFYPHVFERAVRCLRRSLSLRTKIVIIDEIGPLELENGEGFAPILPLLASAGNLLLVVRPALQEQIASFIPCHSRQTFSVTPENRRDLAARILAYILPDSDGENPPSP